MLALAVTVSGYGDGECDYLKNFTYKLFVCMVTSRTMCLIRKMIPQIGKEYYKKVKFLGLYVFSRISNNLWVGFGKLFQ